MASLIHRFELNFYLKSVADDASACSDVVDNLSAHSQLHSQGMTQIKMVYDTAAVCAA